MLHVLTDKGLAEFRSRLSNMRATGIYQSLADLTYEPFAARKISDIEVAFPSSFDSRRDCGVFFCDLFARCADDLRSAKIDPLHSVELWSWFTAKMFENLVANDDGEVHVGEESRLVYMPENHQRFYRHLLAGPYLICREYERDLAPVEILLYNSVTNPNTVYVEQFASRRNILLSRGVMSLVTEMYFDQKRGKGKVFKRPRGTPPTAGSPRRLSVVLNQLSLVWDVMDMSVEQLKTVLPQEFAPLYSN